METIPTPTVRRQELRQQLKAIGQRICTQDNRITQHPMFCVQIKRRDVGYDSDYASGKCWHNTENDQTIYDDDKDFQEPEGPGWGEFGYVDRWETVMVAFTEGGCKEYLELNGHNDRSRAHNGEVRIYAESFNRCPEMIAIRESLMANEAPLLEAIAGAARRFERLFADCNCNSSDCKYCNMQKALSALADCRKGKG